MKLILFDYFFPATLIVLFHTLIVSAQSPDPFPSSNSNGFNADGNAMKESHESWLKRNDRYIFIIILVLILVAIIIWYITRSLRGMRKRLDEENRQNMMMMQQTTVGRNDITETIPLPSDSFHKLPDYSPQQQQQYAHRY